MIRRLFADEALIGATLLLAIFTIAVNKPPPTAAWPPGGVGQMGLEFARDTLDPAAERNFGLALGLSRSSVEAERLLTFAASRSRRDTPTEVWLLVTRLSRGRYDDALRAADAVLRRDLDESKRDSLFTLLIAAAHYDASRPALVARLAESPWWRLTFMRDLAAHASPADIRLVFAGLATTSKPVTDLELALFLESLVNHQDYRTAERDWRTFSRPRRDPDLADDLAAPSPFGWSTVYGGGGSSAVDGAVLRVEYDGFANPQLPRRLFALAPAPYHLSWLETIEGNPRMTVQVLCAGTSVVLASVPAVAGEADRMRSVDFTVPPTGCEGQWLTITPVPGERPSPVSGAYLHWALTAPRLHR